MEPLPLMKYERGGQTIAFYEVNEPTNPKGLATKALRGEMRFPGPPS
jgi:hypothetical protein